MTISSNVDGLYIADWQNELALLRSHLFGTQKQAAEALGLSRDNIAYFETRSKLHRGYLATLMLEYVNLLPDEAQMTEQTELIYKINSKLLTGNSEETMRFLSWSHVEDIASKFLQGIKNKKKHSSGGTPGEATFQWVCEQISRNNLKRFQSKYFPELYLQREYVYQAFQDFLEADELIFVLIGKSGVGKSNFILNMAETLIKDHCLLVYEGASIALHNPLAEKITQDILDQWNNASLSTDQLWKKIPSLLSSGASERPADRQKFILLIDAVNECPQASELLRQIDELAQKGFPGLKIIITSRPETWKSIKRGTRLSESLYYRTQDEIFFEMGAFEYSQQMTPFLPEELVTVYQKYQQQFLLKTDYEQIPANIRSVLSDPLNLFMVAQTYREMPIPKTISVNRLVEQYIDALKKRNSLQSEDLRYLKQYIVLLMADADKNQLTEIDFDLANTYTAVFEAGQSSLENLINADIIDRTDQVEQAISFKYERFYEYFLGKQIYENSMSAPDRAAYFFAYCIKAMQRPYIWGVLRNALALEAQFNGIGLLQKLYKNNQTDVPIQRIKDICVSALCFLGDKDQALLNQYLPMLITKGKNAQDRTSREIVAGVAYNLGLTDYLYLLAKHEDEVSLSLALNFSFRLFRNDHQQGLLILKKLSKDVYVFRTGALKPFIYLAALIFFDKYHDPEVVQEIQLEMRAVFNRLIPGFAAISRPEIFPRVIISSLVSLVDHMISLSPATAMVKMETFSVPKDADERALYERLITYFEPESDMLLDPMRRDFSKIASEQKRLYIIVASLVLFAQGVRWPDRTIGMMRIFIEETPFYAALIGIITEMIISFHPENQALADFLVECIESAEGYYRDEYLPMSQAGHPYDFYHSPCLLFSEYITSRVIRKQAIQTEWLNLRIQRAIDNQDIEFFYHLLQKSDLPEVAIHRGYPKAALDVLDMFFDCEIPDVQKMIFTFLGQLRLYYPDEVDDFLDYRRVPTGYRLNLIYEQVESGEAQIMMKARLFVFNEVIVASPGLHKEMSQILSLALDSKDIHDWIGKALYRTIRIIYGSASAE